MIETSKKFSFVVIGRIFGGILQGLFFIIFAYLLKPNEFGELSYLIAIAGFFSILFRFGFNQSLLILLGKNNSELVPQLNFISLIGITIGGLFLLPYNFNLSFLCIGISFFTLSQYFLLGKKQFKNFLLISIIKGLLMIILSLILFQFFEINGIIFGVGITSILLSFYYLRSLSSLKFPINFKENFKFFLNNFGVDSSMHLTRTIDKIIIAPFLDFNLIGIYQFNLQILLGLEMLPIAFHNFFLSEESNNKKNKKIEIYSILITILIIAIVVILSPIVILNYFSDYSEGIFSLQIMVLSLLPLTIGTILTAKIQSDYRKNTGSSVIVKIGIFIILIFSLGTFYGNIGLSLSILFSYTAYAIYLVYLTRK